MKWFSKKKKKITNEAELTVTETIDLEVPVTTPSVEDVKETPAPVNERPVEEPVIPMEFQPAVKETSDKVFI